MSTLPDSRGRFGEFGGRFVPETVMGALDELEAGYAEATRDPQFKAQLERLHRDYVGRPSPLYLAERLSGPDGPRIYLKREDLNHTGAHKINNAVGQALLTVRLGKRRVVAETGAGMLRQPLSKIERGRATDVVVQVIVKLLLECRILSRLFVLLGELL